MKLAKNRFSEIINTEKHLTMKKMKRISIIIGILSGLVALALGLVKLYHEIKPREVAPIEHAVTPPANVKQSVSYGVTLTREVKTEVQ